MTKGYKRSPLCSNCDRDKRLVTPSLANYPSSNWLMAPYCEECAHKQCRDITGFEPCPDRRMVVVRGQHPAQYRDYCAKHWPQYGFCPQRLRRNRSCGAPKEVWMPMCWECHARTEAIRIQQLQWRQRKQEIVQEKAAKVARAKRRRKPWKLYKELKQ
jgi:hypothetical protein